MSDSVDPVRTRLVEGGGHCWSVVEANYPTSTDPVGRCLIFSCDAIVRRVRDYPADWRSRSDRALYEVSFSI
jgi:hypothetical protein